jgi:hypothetical protein
MFMTNVIKVEYDGATWYGYSRIQTPPYDLLINSAKKNVL